MLSYRNRLLLIGGVVTLAILGTIFLQAPQPTLTVDELIEQVEEYYPDLIDDNDEDTVPDESTGWN